MTITETPKRRLTQEEVSKSAAYSSVMQLERHEAMAETGASPCTVAWCDQSGQHMFEDEEYPN